MVSNVPTKHVRSSSWIQGSGTFKTLDGGDPFLRDVRNNPPTQHHMPEDRNRRFTSVETAKLALTALIHQINCAIYGPLWYPKCFISSTVGPNMYCNFTSTFFSLLFSSLTTSFGVKEHISHTSHSKQLPRLPEVLLGVNTEITVVQMWRCVVW